MRGFFPKSKLKVTKAPTSLIPKCGACGLFRACKSPKMEPFGNGKRKILIIGEAPGKHEDEQGRPFVGASGQLLEETLRRGGVELRRDCLITNSLICRPPENRDPKGLEVDHCRPNLIKTLDEFKPEIIIPLGAAAIQSLIPIIFREDNIGGIERWAGWRIPCQKINAWICPTYHPSFVLRSDKNTVPGMLFRKHLERAAKLKGRPWDVVPDYDKLVQRVLDPSRAAKIIREITAEGRPSAFDYEATALNPEHEDAKLVCFSISNGRTTIAAPYLGEAVDALREFVVSNVPKVAANLKMEERWTRYVLGKRVRHWVWDIIIAAHCLDNRPGITGLKFQQFALLGGQSYDDHLKHLLKSKGDDKINQVAKEIDLDQLLLYCGIDSLVEIKIARIQAKQIGVSLNEL